MVHLKAGSSRASAFYSRDGGYIDNISLGEDDVNRSQVYGGRLDLLLTPTDRLTLRLSGFAQNIRRNGDSTADYSVNGEPENSPLDQQRLIPEPFQQQFRLVSATINYDLESLKVASISSYQTTSERRTEDYSTRLVPILSSIGLPYSSVGAATGVRTNKFTQEVRLSSPGHSTIEWLIGGFYTNENSQNVQDFVLRDLAGQPAPNTLFTYSAPSQYQEFAGFGDLTYNISSRFDLTGGIRYAYNRQTYSQIGSGLLIGSEPKRGSHEGVITYLANARYHISDHVLTYLRYATGYRPGGANAVSNDPSTGLPTGPATFDADHLRSYEAGAKAETPDRTFSIDLAGYYIDWTNIQVQAVRNGFGVVVNAAGGATVRGAELTLTAKPTRGFVATGAFAYQDAHLSEADADLGGAKGERLPNVPRFTAAINADYELVDVKSRPAIGATIRFISDRKASFDNSSSFPQYNLPDYAQVDLRAGLKIAPVSIQIYVHNLFDVRSELAMTNFRGLIAPTISQPRTIGLSAATSF